ncbi:MAG: hypothetical protein JSR60_16575 [Proteobacteria bacterium]|nr:hypothetical protein [Pseudomonadota bacterium]
MKSALALGTSLLLLASLPAAAASYPGQDVSVNQSALGSGYLLYPGGKYGRFVPHLLQPGEKPARTIHLHMPRKVTVVRPRAPKPAAPVDVATAPPPAPVESTPPPKPRVARTTPSTPPASTPTATPDISAMPENSASRLVGATATPPVTRPRRAAPVAGGAAAFAATIASPPPKTVATAVPPPATTPPATTPPATPADDTAGMSRQSIIPFAAGSSTPAASDINAIHGLAGKLTAALSAGASRVQLQAYGGPRGDKSSDSRRLSLKRALVIRELLIEDGVPSEKIDVRAMGGVDDNSAPDRVDIFLRS